MSALTLPRLRHLYCVNNGVQDVSLRAFLPTLNLLALAAPKLEFIAYEGGLEALGKDRLEDLPNLIHLPCLNAMRSQSSTLLPFLKNNPQLTILDTHIAWNANAKNVYSRFLRRDLNRLCADELLNELTSLSLELDGPFSKETLACIAQLPRLEKLLLSGSQWHIKHKHVLATLQPLTNLRCLAFQRDIYIKQWPESTFSHRDNEENIDGEYYHPLKVIVSQKTIEYLKLDSENMTEEALFDRVHYHMMIYEAHQYALAFPKLEWIFVGCHPFAIKNKVEAWSLSRHRIHGKELFKHIFGVNRNNRIFRHVESMDLWGSPRTNRIRIPWSEFSRVINYNSAQITFPDNDDDDDEW